MRQPSIQRSDGVMGAQQGRLEGAGEGLEKAHREEPQEAGGRLNAVNRGKETSFHFSISFFKDNDWPETSKHQEVEEARENLPIQLHRTVLRIMPAGVPFQVDKGLPIQAARKLPMQVDKDPAIQHQVMSSHGRMELPVQFKTRV